MRSRGTAKFCALFRMLPPEIQKSARDKYRLFRSDPRHGSLQFKQVHASRQIYSVRFSLDYSAVGVMSDDGIIWFWTGSHRDYERLIRGL
jgi:hypothetical protein